MTDGKSEQDVSGVVKNFAAQLKKDGQLKSAGKIMQKFSELYDRAHGIVAAEIQSREELPQDVLQKVEKFVKERYGAKEVELKIAVNEGVRGGIIVKVGDEVLDASVKAQLKRLKKQLAS